VLPPESHARRQAVLQGMTVAVGCWVLLSVLALLHVTEAFDMKLLDWRFRLRGPRPPNDAIVLVGVDDATIHAYHAWPLPRDAYALLLTALEDGGAHAIGVDLQFPSDRNQDPRFDALLAYVSSSHDNIVNAVGFQSGAAAADTGVSPTDAEGVARRQGLVAFDVPAPEAGTMTLPFPELANSGGPLGHINVSIDKDGTIRRLPFFVRHTGRLYPALSLRVLCVAEGARSLPEVRRAGRGAEVRWSRSRRLRIPLDREGSTTLDFAGDRAAFPGTYSMLEVLQWYRAGDRERLRRAFDGRIVLLGLTSTREVTDDVSATPFSEATPLVYVHANAIDACLREAFIRTVPGWLAVLILGAVALPLGWLFMVLSLPQALLLAGTGVLAVAGADQALFALGRIDVPPLLLLAAPPLTYAAIQSRRYIFLERRSRQREEEIRHGRSVQQQFLPEALNGQTLSRYHIMGTLGRGGMGVVYRGEDLRLRRAVAVKVLPGGTLADDSQRRRFRREARALSRLTHPHIARLYDFDTQDGIDFLVLELVEGETLADRLDRGPLGESEIVRLGSQILGALQDAHDHGVVHRDLKPANVVVTSSGDAKLLDFGIARSLQADSTSGAATLTGTDIQVGTPAYMAPEVILGNKADSRTDIYGVGLLLYEMATARRPFPDDSPHELFFTIVNQEPPEPRVLNRRISIDMERVILKALQKDSDRRHQTAAEMLQELTAFSGART
jgi:CHASE2 domain-containing sensor protein